MAISALLGGGDAIPFGGRYEGPTPDDVFLSSKRIKTYTETIEENTSKSIATHCKDAENMIFLGFGFHPQNMKIISESDIKIKNNIFSTIYQQSDFSQEIIRGQLRGFVQNIDTKVHLHDGTCETFFERYEMGLTRY